MFELVGDGADLLARLSVWVTLALLAVTFLRVAPAARTPAGLWRGAAALVLALLLGSKVLSPQYIAWLVPLLTMAAVAGPALDWPLAAALLAIAALTGLTYPGELGIADADLRKQLEVVARNLILLATWAYLLRTTGSAAGTQAP